MAEFPALPLWTDAYLADTGHLSYEEHGLYLHILMTMWRTPACQMPNDDAWINRKFGAHADAVRTLCGEFCILSDDRKFWWQKRLRKQWRWCCEKRGKATESANRRWDKNKDISERNPNGQQSESERYASKSKSKSSKKEGNLDFEGSKKVAFKAPPHSPEWVAWKSYYEDTKQNAHKRFLDGRELEGRPFEFESQWPPTGKPQNEQVSTTS